MTKEELISLGWKEELCKIGYLYFKDNYFIRLDKDKALVFSVHDDMHPIGKASTYDEILSLEREADKKDILWLEATLISLKESYKKKYNLQEFI